MRHRSAMADAVKSSAPHSVRRTLLSVLILLLSLQLLLTGFLLNQGAREYRLSQKIEFINQVGDGIATAYPVLGLERGRVNALLHSQGLPSQQNLALLGQFRTQSNMSLQRAQDQLAGQSVEWRDKFQRLRDELAHLRQSVDHELQLPMSQRQPEMVEGWVSKSGGLMDRFRDLLEALSQDNEGLDFKFDVINQMRLNVMRLRFSAGDESARYTGVVSKGEEPAQEVLAIFPKLRQQTLQVWYEQSHQGRLLGSAEILSAHAAVEHELFDQLWRLQDNMLSAWKAKSRPSIGADDYARISAKALSSVSELIKAIASTESAYAAEFSRHAKQVFLGALLVTLVSVGLMILGLKLATRQVIAPLEALSRAATRIAQGEADVTMPQQGASELQFLTGQLGRMVSAQSEAMAQIGHLNASLERRVAERTSELEAALSQIRATQDQLVRSAKLASLGSLVAGIAHELNTPIGNALLATTTIKAVTENFRAQAARGLRRSDLEQHVSDVIDGSIICERNLKLAGDLVAKFKEVSADNVGERRREFDLREVVDTCMGIMKPTLLMNKVVVLNDVAPSIVMNSFPGAITQVITNLIMNSVVHAFDGKDDRCIIVRAQFSAALEAEQLELVLSDNGCGIAPHIVDRIFDPFFTTRMGRGGTGLGLNIVLNLVEKVLGGHIEVKTSDEGSQFKLKLPRVAPMRDEQDGK
jgi:signal transduction histidine kinase